MDAKMRVVDQAKKPRPSPASHEDSWLGKRIEDLTSAEYTAYLASGLGG